MPTPYQAALDAIYAGDSDAFGHLLRTDPSLASDAADRPDWPDATLLDHAVWWHRDDIVDQLVRAGAPVARPGGSPARSPLRRALEMGVDRLADRLGAATDFESAAGLGDAAAVRKRLPEADEGTRRRAFRLACLNGRRETARQLCPPGWFDDDALVDALLTGRRVLTWDEGETAWDWAKFQLELANPLNVMGFDSPDDAGRTMIEAAQAGGHPGAITLVERRRPSRRCGVAPERIWRPFNSPYIEDFLFACQWGQPSRVREFLEADQALVHECTMWDNASLYMPGAYGSDGSVATGKLLLDAGADPFDGIAGPSWWGAVEYVQSMLAAGAPTERPAPRDSGLLNACAATRYNEPERYEHWLPIIEALLDHGADPNFADRFGVTPWGFAHDSVRPLLEARGARPEPRHPGIEPLRRAIKSGSAEVEARIAADPELLDFYDEATGCTPALALLLDGHRDQAEALLAGKRHPDINEAAALGDLDMLAIVLDRNRVRGPRAGPWPPQAPLHFAAWLGRMDIVTMLLDRGYSPAAMNRNDVAGKYQGHAPLRDTTPLHVAAEAGQIEVLSRLLDAWHDHWRPA